MLKVSHFQMLGKFLCMNSPVTILISLRLDWSWCVTRKQNQAKAKPFKFIFKSFLRRSKTGLSRRFPIDWLTLDKRKVDIWDSPPVPNLVFSPPPPEFLRAGVGGGPVYADVKRKSSCIDNNGGNSAIFIYYIQLIHLLTAFALISILACSLASSVPLVMKTSPFLRITFAPVLLLISIRFLHPLPNTKPLYSFGTSTSSSRGVSVLVKLLKS